MRLPLELEPAWFELPDSDDWYTPYYIFEGLGLSFDLDPCAPPGGLPWIPAAVFYSELEDGLAQPWHGLVWLNPPYSEPAPWVHRLAEHGEGVALLPADTSTELWNRWVTTAAVVCFLRSRVRFIAREYTNINGAVTSARFPSALVGWGERAARALVASGLGWCVRGVV